MDAMVSQLAQTRERKGVIVESIRALEVALSQTDQGQMLESLKADLAQTNAELDSQTAELRSVALTIWHESGDKRPHPAVTIKQYTVLDYDPSVALSYCITNMTGALKLDRKAFEKAAQAVEPDFVNIFTEARATIARDLSEWL